MARHGWMVPALLSGPAGALALLLLPPSWIEHAYSRSWFPATATGLARVFGSLPFSAAEVALALAVVLVAGAVALAVGRRGSFLRGVVGALSVASVTYFTFIVLWGLNYGREPAAVNFDLPVQPTRPDELRSLLDVLIAEAGRARGGVPEGADGVATIPGGIAAALAGAPGWFLSAGVRWPLLAGERCPPKAPVGGVLLSWLGIGGIYSPFTGEPNVNVDSPLFTLPFAALHEMAHGRGFAVEAEANYVAVLVGRDFGDVSARYASLYNALLHVAGALMEVDPEGTERLWRDIHPGIRRDQAAVRAWRARYDGPARIVAGAVNDAYLKSQGVTEGVRSYGLVVDLLLAERRAQSGSR